MSEDESQRLLHRTLLGEAIENLEGAAVFLWDEERRYAAVNDEACALVGLSRAELIGMPVGALSDGGASADIEATQRARLRRGGHTITRADGDRVALEWLTIHTRVAGLPYMLSVVWPAGAAG